MAVTQTGSATVIENNTTSEWSQNITVPTDAELCVVVAIGWINASYVKDSESGVAELNWDGDDNIVDFTWLASAGAEAGSGNYQPLVEVYYEVNPSTGNQTLYGKIDASDEGWSWIVMFFKGVDTADPFGSVEQHYADGAGNSAYTTSLASCPAGDLAVIGAYAYNQSPDVNPSGYGQTAVNESVYNSAGAGVGYEDGETALRVENCTYTGYVAFVIQASASGETISFTVTDAVKLSDSSSGSLTMPVTVSDAIKFDDSSGGTLTMPVTVSDAVKFADSPDVILTMPITVTDAIKFSDTPSANLKIGLNIADGVKFDDSPGGKLNLDLLLTDAIKFSDIFSSNVTFTVSFSDGVKFSDQPTEGGAISITISDGVKFADSISTVQTLLLNIADGVKFSDSPSGTLTIQATITDGIKFSDALSTAFKYVLTFSDRVKFSDVAIESSTLAQGKIQITVSTKQVSFTITSKQPNQTITSKQMDIDITGG